MFAIAVYFLNSDRQISQISKIYLGKASGKIPKDQFRITNPISKIPHDALDYIHGATAGGEYAVSECQVVKRDDEFTIVKVNILTSRPHQIRIHLAAFGHPLVGDPLHLIGGIPHTEKTENGKYATPSDLGYWLHNHYLEFNIPQRKK